MIHIEKYIAELVGNHDCVIVPGLGAFVALATSADIHPITHKFTAPGRTLSFNAQIKVNDGLLAAEISRIEGVSFQEANAIIEEYVKQFNSSLSVFKHYNCNGIGRFFYNVGGKLEFEPDFTINFSSDSFGLTDFIFKPIDRNTYDMNPTTHRKAKEVPVKDTSAEGVKSKTSVMTKVLFVLMPLIVLIGAAGVVVYNQQDDVSLGGFHVFESLGLKKEKAAVDTAVKSVAVDSVAEISNEEIVPAVDSAIIEEAPQAAEVVAPVKEAVKSKKAVQVNASEAASGSYYIIIGAFKNESNADKLYAKLQSENKSATKLSLDANGFYKVAVGSFESMEAANAELASLQETYSGIWIKKY